MVVGDRRKYNCVLVTLANRPDTDGNPTSVLAGEALALGQAQVPPISTVEEARDHPAFKEYVQVGAPAYVLFLLADLAITVVFAVVSR